MYNRRDLADPSVVQNRSKFLANISASIDNTVRLGVSYERENFCEYKEVAKKHAGFGMRGKDSVIADALITKDSTLTLFLPVADCVGAAIYDPTQNIVALAHLGRHSLEQNGGTKIIEHLTGQYGSDPKDLKIWLTPAPGKDVYTIWALENKGMKEAAFEQLFAAGILPKNITDNTAETDKDPNYYSYSEFLKGNKKEDGDHAIAISLQA